MPWEMRKSIREPQSSVKKPLKTSPRSTAIPAIIEISAKGKISVNGHHPKTCAEQGE